ncbi:MAG: hypothetical protein ACI4K8_03875 [Candidatus Fimenecus sp.]
MAFNINVKKKDSGAPAEKQNILEDIRVFVVLMAIACIGLIVLIVFGVKSNEEIKTEIAKEKKAYQENQLSIANLKALQARSSEFEAQRDMYNAMIPDTQDRQAVMIDMERRVEGARCTLADLTFGGDAAIGGTANTNAAAAAAAPTNTSGLKELQVLMTVRGSYADIMGLCSDLVTDPELMRIDGIQMKPISNGEEQEATITLMKFSKQ